VLAATALCCALAVGLPADGRVATITAVQLSGVVLTLAALVVHRPARHRQWLAVTGGGLLFTLAWHALAAGAPKLVTVCLVGAYALTCHAALLVGRTVERRRALFRLDVTALAVMAFAVAWHVLRVPVPGAADAQAAWMAVQAGGDLALAAIILRVLALRPRTVPSLWLLVGTAGSVFCWHVLTWWSVVGGSYEPGAAVDVLGVAPWGLLAAAAWHPSMRDVGRPGAVAHHRRSRGLPLIGPVALGMPLLPLLDEAGVVDVDLAVLGLSGMVMLALLLARTSLVTRRATDLAHTDALTGLANRRVLESSLARQLAHGGAATSTLLLMDLDRFKDVNDTHGHAAGDELLREVATRLRSAMPRRSLVARLGGDEFAVLVPDDRGEEPSAAERLLAAFEEPADIGGARLRAEVSVGVVPVRAPVGLEAENPRELAAAAASLLVDADLALYAAKREGVGAVVSTPALRAGYERERRLWEALPAAIATGEGLVPYYQPMLGLDDAHVGSVEALIRWEHPELGLLPPAEFLDVAQRLGLMAQLDEVVLRRAAADLAGWHAAGIEDLVVAVNLSAETLMRADLVELATDAFASAGLPVSDLLLEITEHHELPDDEQVAARLQRLRDAGVFVALDDFGVGYATMGYLVRFPMSGIKLDRSLVARVHEPRGSQLLAAVVALAHGLGVEVLAEGVETPLQAEAVRALGFDFAQGFHYARPMPAGEFADWVLRHRAAVGPRTQTVST
jgi:diguanylate cyclase (GGDEF)-like protein